MAMYTTVKLTWLAFCLSLTGNYGNSENGISTGCYLDSVSNSDFYINPDMEIKSNQLEMTSDLCIKYCLKLDDQLKYAGIQFKNTCLCAYQLTNKEKIGTSDCVWHDSIGEEVVQTQISLIEEVHIEPVSLSCQEIQKEIENDVLSVVECVMTPSNPEVKYIFNFGDGGLSTLLSDSPKAKNEYFIPGKYKISAAEVQPNGFYVVKYQTVDVNQKLEIASKLAMECPRQVDTEDILICNVTSFSGTNMKFTVSPTGEECPLKAVTYNLPDITKVSFGLAFPETEPMNEINLPTLDTKDASYIVIPSSFVTSEGTISTIKLFLVAPGNIELKVLRPKFSVPYCPKAVSCKGSVSKYEVLSYKFPEEVGKYSQKKGLETVIHKISNGPVVQTNDVLAFKYLTSGKTVIGYRKIIEVELSDFTLTKTMSYGKKLNVQHYIQAIVTPKSGLVFGQSPTENGICTFSLMLQSEGPAGEVVEKSDFQKVLIGPAKEDFILKCDTNATDGKMLTVQATVTQTRRFNKIIWQLGGGLKNIIETITNKTAKKFTQKFVYPKPGSFNVNVTMESEYKTITHSCEMKVELRFIDTDWSFNSTSPQVAPSNIKFFLIYEGNNDFQTFGEITMTWNWGDGSENEISPLTQSFHHPIHHYENTGHYNVSVMLSNPVNHLKLRTQVIMLDKMILKVTASFRTDMSSYRPGLGPDANIFRIGSTVKFQLKCIGASEGDVNDYAIQWPNGSIYDINKKDVWPAEHIDHFDQPGNYSIKFFAMPSIGSPIETVFDVIIMDSDWNFNVYLDDYFMEVDKEVPRELGLDSTCPTSCVIVDFADGSPYKMYGPKEICENLKIKDPLLSKAKWTETSSNSFPMNITHMYHERNNYNVTLYGFTKNSTRITSKMIFVNSYPYRPKPEVWILVNSTEYLYPLQIRRSDYRKIETGATISYNDSYTLEIRTDWTIWQVDEDDAVKDIREKNWIEEYKEPTNKSYLTIMPQLLPYGLYKIIYNYSVVKVNGKDLGNPLMVSAFTYLRIISSDLLPILIKHSLRYVERGYGQMISLNPAKFSIDPDNTSDPFSVKLICRDKKDLFDNFDDINVQDVPEPGNQNSGTGGGCFGGGPGVVNVENGVWELNTSSFYKNNIEVTVLAKVMKDSRSAIGLLDIKVIPDPIPVLDLRCTVSSLCQEITNGYSRLNPSQRLSMIGTCVENCSGLKYGWRFSHDPQPIPSEEENAQLIGEDMEMMGLAKNYTDKQTEFRITFYVHNQTDDVVDEAAAEGESVPAIASISIDFVVDKQPEGGTCELQDMEIKRALLDIFTIQCQDWFDPDNTAIKLYKAYSIDQEGYENVLITTSTSTFDLILKPGNLTLHVEISDGTGAFTIYKFDTIEVIAPTIEEFNDFVDTKLLYFRLTGNQFQLAQAIQAIQVLQSFYGIDRPDFKAESAAHGKLTEANIQYLKDLSCMTYNSMDDLEVMANTAANVVGDGHNIDKTGRKIAGDLMEELDKIYMEPEQVAATFTTPFLAKTYLTNALSVLGGIAVSTSNQLANSLVTEGDLNHADEIDVDTSVPIGQSDLSIPKDSAKTIEQAILNDAAKQAIPELARFDRMILNHQNQILRNLVAEEEPLEIKTLSGLMMRLERGTNGHLQNITNVLGAATIKFPDFCRLYDNFENCYEDQDIAYAATLWNCLFPAFGFNSKNLNNASNTIDVNVYSGKLDTVTKIDIVNSTDNIEITVPRKNKNIALPDGILVYPKTKWFEKMMYHQIRIQTEGSSVNLIFRPDSADPRFLIFLRYKFKPYLHKYDLLWDTSQLESDENNIFYIHVGGDLIDNKKGKFYVGIVQLFENATQNYVINHTVVESFVDSNFTTNYSMSVFASGCHFYNYENTIWKIEGCAVVAFTKETTTCSCNHLTKFASSFSVPPNPINFQYVFTHAGFINNTTIYATIIATFALFILFLIWARYKDNKDLEKLKALPLPDNKQEDKYIYEILVFTGTCKQAGTESRVSFVLTGDTNETEIRTFGSNFPRKTFARGGTDVFVMTEPRPLGQLLLLRIWHDNSGAGYNASWNLNYIIFRDVQTGEKFEFIAQCWFAVEKGDRQIERIIPVADKHSLLDFDHLFTTTGPKKLKDSHLWFSIFCRRPRNRFTRCQRVATCIAFLYLSMVTNAMWYQTVPDKPSSGYQFGPFSLGLEEFVIGFLSDIITFPPLFLIIFFFQKSKPRKLRRSRIDEALDQQRDIYGHSSTSSNKTTNALPLRKYKRSKSFTLPWIFRIIAWLLCIGVICATVFFLWAYGIQFGDTKTKKWLTALVISFVSSVFITQPIKVFLAVLVLSAVCKKVETDEDDADEDEEDPHLYFDERWLHETGAKPNITKVKHSRNLEDYDKIKVIKQKEVKSWMVIKEIFVYLVFVSLAITVSYGIHDPNSYLMVSTLKTGFVDRKGINGFSFMSINSADDYWMWLNDVFMSQLRAGPDYANKPPFGQVGFLADRVNRIMGNSILRQVRIKKDRCECPISLRNFSKCTGSYTSFVDEDDEDYDIDWQKMNTSLIVSKRDRHFYTAFNYSSAEELQGLVFVGNLDAYGGGGYVYHIVADIQDVKKDFERLKDNNWIDHRTRALFIEFSVYNAQVNLFGVVTLLAEFIPGGGINTDYFIDAMQLLSYETDKGYVLMVLEIIYMLFIIAFTINELRQFYKQRFSYFRSYGNLNEFLLILCSYAALAIHIYRFLIVEDFLAIFQKTKGSQYINLQRCKFLTDLYASAVAFAVFFGFLKLIKLLRFNRNILTLSRTLIQVAKDLWGFGLILLIVVIAFGFLFYLVYCTTLLSYASFIQSIKTLVSVSLNRFEFDLYLISQPVLGPIIFFSFAFIISIVLINLLITIIIQSFDNVKRKMRNYKNEAEVIDFLSRQTRNLLNPNSSLTHVPTIDVVEDEPDSAFSNKMDTLMNYVNKVYFDDRLDMSKKNWRYKNKHFNFDSNEVKPQVYNSN